MRRELLVLANSFKQHGQCIAGRFATFANGKWSLGDWCRPVAPDGYGNDAMPRDVCSHFNPLDIVSIELAEHVPVEGQPENWLWEPDTSITQRHTLNSTPDVLKNVVEEPNDIWLDVEAYRPDAVRADHCIERSLYLVQPADLQLKLTRGEDGRKKILAEFEYLSHRYESIPVTDPIIFRIMTNQFPDEGVKITPLRNEDRYWLTVSIGVPFGPMNCRYKFVAAIIDHSGYLQRNYR